MASIHINKQVRKTVEEIESRVDNDINNITGGDWAFLIVNGSPYAELADWDKLNGHHWSIIMYYQPDFGGYCNWDKLSRMQWSFLLTYRPQFTKYCDMTRMTVFDRTYLRLLHNDYKLFLDMCEEQGECNSICHFINLVHDELGTKLSSTPSGNGQVQFGNNVYQKIDTTQ